MSRPLTMGSLFSGIGGFELAGTLCGIKPVWASEVLPFPIRVTTKRFPDMVHLGDINHICGSKIPPVDIITGGFCCQDLSVGNGKRVGLHGERSGLFFEMIRIIKEMREATGQRLPAYAVFENVMGIFSSNEKKDFCEVLNEIVKIKNKLLSVPMPPDSKWHGAGEIVADNFSVAYRCYDASAWGTAQRRRRCFIVVDFNGGNAGKIQFDETRLRGNPPQCGFPWESLAGNPALGVGVSSVERKVSGTVPQYDVHLSENAPALVYDARGNGDGVTVNTITGDHENRVTDYTAIVLDGVSNTPEPKTLKIRSGCEGGGKGILVQDNLSATLATHNDQTVFVPVPAAAFGICSLSSNSMKSSNPNSGIYEADTARTLDRNGGSPLCNQGGLCVVSIQGSMIGRSLEAGPQGSGFCENVSHTLTQTDRHGVAYTVTSDYRALGCEEKSTTLQARDCKPKPSSARPRYIVL